MKTSIRGGLAGRLTLACALSAPLVIAAAHAQPASDPVKLDQVVVSATRMPTDPRATPSVVTLLNPSDLADAVGRLLSDEAARNSQRQGLSEALQRLGYGGPSPSRRAARAVLGLIGRKA